MDYAENYVHISRLVLPMYLHFHLKLMWLQSCPINFFLQTDKPNEILSQAQHSTVMFIIIAHYWNFALNKKEAVAYFFITDDVKKRHEQVQMNMILFLFLL